MSVSTVIAGSTSTSGLVASSSSTGMDTAGGWACYAVTSSLASVVDRAIVLEAPTRICSDPTSVPMCKFIGKHLPRIKNTHGMVEMCLSFIVIETTIVS